MNKNVLLESLPEGYKKLDEFDLNKNRGHMMIINLLGLNILFVTGWLLILSLSFLRPEYLSSKNILVITGMREFWRGLLLLVISLGLMILLTESIRGLIFLTLTRRFPKIRLRGFFQTKYFSNWYLTRWAYLTIRLLPILIVTLIGMGVVPLIPLNIIPGVLLMVALNIATATADFANAFWLLWKPRDILIRNEGDCIEIFQV